MSDQVKMIRSFMAAHPLAFGIPKGAVFDS